MMFINATFMYCCNSQKQIFSIAISISKFIKEHICSLRSHKLQATYYNTQSCPLLTELVG